uniref:hypothetical protein n=1 Tax=Roseivirga sp. TaxID=1964215 RepID=UPI004047F3F2
KLRVLAIRNDKLGDFMLIWPALMLLPETVNIVHVRSRLPNHALTIKPINYNLTTRVAFDGKAEASIHKARAC